MYRGFADFYGGQGAAQNAAWRYLNPSLVGSQRLFRELSHDTPALERFLVETSRLVGDLASRRDSLSGVVDNLATTLGAIAREEGSLSTAVHRLRAVHAPGQHDAGEPAQHARRRRSARA